MNAYRWFALVTVSLVALGGCSKEGTNNPKAEGVAKAPTANKEPTPEQEAKIKAGLSKLPDADRQLAEAQKFCPIQKTRLGSMGRPDRIELEGQPVFLCCSSCEDDARADPKKTLAEVQKLKNGK